MTLSFRWRFSVDRGGTFTDCVGLDTRSSEVRVAKVLSSDLAPVVGIREILGIQDGEPIPPCDVRIGTTIATNALLERKGAPTAFLTSRGFEDALRIGDQTRPDLFALDVERPLPLPHWSGGLPARHDAKGRIMERPAPGEADAMLDSALEAGCSSLAIVLVNAHASSILEEELERLAHRAGFAHVTRSSALDPVLGFTARAFTTVADAYLTPLVLRHLEELQAALPGSRIRVMQSNGGLAPLRADGSGASGKDLVLSGPAGGVVALGGLAHRIGGRQLIGFDMGGTSSDVSRWEGEPVMRRETTVAGVPLRTPMVELHTVAAGGGSLCRLLGQRMTVGPDSAGHTPGPLCYGHKGARELTLTDVNLALGRLVPQLFPFPLQSSRVEEALARFDDPLAAAHGFFEVAVSTMAAAIRRVTVGRGFDARTHDLVIFGGAAGQVACSLARQLGIRRIVVPPSSGLLSAVGIGQASVRWDGAVDGEGRMLGDGDGERAYRQLEAQAKAVLQSEPGQLHGRRQLDLRVRGTEHVLTVDDGPDAARDFAYRWTSQFGASLEGREIEIVAYRVAARSEAEGLEARASEGRLYRGEQRIFLGREWVDCPVLGPLDLEVSPRCGPVIVADATSTVVVEPGHRVHRTTEGDLIIEAQEVDLNQGERLVLGAIDSPDPVTLEILSNGFMSVAEQMGTVLQSSAVSTNIHDRRDFSCAIFDAEGQLLANAPHIPVHLGAMSETVKSLIAERSNALVEDSAFLTNDPFAGGSHLPDLTVISPVFIQGHLRFFLASRGHHADIGGIAPGSMPPFSRSLEEEGVVFRHMTVRSGDRVHRAELEAALRAGPHPARRPEENLQDIEAQLAANHSGQRFLADLIERHGLETVVRYAEHVRDDASRQVERFLRAMPQPQLQHADVMDDGVRIQVRVDISDGRARFDFAGTSPAVDGNLNAPPAVTVAAILYVLRVMTSAAMPLNSGCLERIELALPKGSLLDPPWGAAVCGGNVETSQRVVDVLLAAFGASAAAQGTMNNLSFGTRDFGYYETIGGGAGGTPSGAGASGVQTHMTNTRITDVEVLERRYPVHLECFEVREGSGGAGRRPGGDGLRRRYRFLEPVSLSILSDHRRSEPFGLAGGYAGARGKNWIDGTLVGGRGQFNIRKNQTVTIETPGGGGWGPPGDE